MKSKPDDRRNNVDRIQKNIDMTLHNMELADELIDKTSDDKMKQTLSAKNQRRDQALQGMRHEIQDEAKHRKEQGKHRK